MTRIERLQAAMAEQEVDVAVLGPSANLRWALDYDALAVDRLTALLVSRESAVMILPDFDAEEFVGRTGFEAVALWADRRGPAPAVADAFTQLGLDSGRRRAVVDDELPFLFFTALREELGDGAGLLSELLGPIRLIKSTDEQARIACAGELVSVGVDIALDAAEPGISELALKRRIEEAMWDGGAESVDYVLVQAGANSASPHHSADATVLAAGEPVLIDIAVRLDGYYADITQQVFLGAPTAEYAERYEIVREAQLAGVAAAQPGTPVTAVAEAASAVIADAGWAEWSGPRTGHGIGLDVHEPPSVVEGVMSTLAPGTVITVEPGLYLPGRFGIRIEDTVVVTADGPRCVTRGSRPLRAR